MFPPPLCLPRTVDAFAEMKQQLKELINKFCGPAQGDIGIHDNRNDDALAEFSFHYKDETGCVRRCVGTLQALWQCYGNEVIAVYVKVEIDGFTNGKEWRIYT